MTREIQYGLGGWTNPDSDIPCGPKDVGAKFPEPVHIGGCKECARRIREALKARLPAKAKGAEPEQTEFDFWSLE